jgi:hypothetical protein
VAIFDPSQDGKRGIKIASSDKFWFMTWCILTTFAGLRKVNSVLSSGSSDSRLSMGTPQQLTTTSVAPFLSVTQVRGLTTQTIDRKNIEHIGARVFEELSERLGQVAFPAAAATADSRLLRVGC